MKPENLKQLIRDNYLNASEAIWLIKACNKYKITSDKLNLSPKDYHSLINSIKSQLVIENIEDDLYFFSIELKFNRFFSINEESSEGDLDDEDENSTFPINPFTQEQLLQLKEIEQKILEIGQEKMISNFMEYLEQDFPHVYNGFNRSEYTRAKSHYWKTIGFEEYKWWVLSDKIKQFLINVYIGAEPFINEKVNSRELSILPELKLNFEKWTLEHNYKANKTNLKEFLKNNGYKISNPNMDKILST